MRRMSIFLSCALLVAAAGATPWAHAAGGPPPIVSISVCAPDGGGSPSGSCPDGTADTARAVRAPDGSPLDTYGGLSTLADEHSTILPPGTLPGHPDYLFFVATRTNLNPISSGVVVLSGSGPDARGQWTLDFAPDYGPYDPANPAGSQNGQIFLSPMDHDLCPTVTELDRQDRTFDLNYADPGSVVVDPTNRADQGPGRLLMVYEGTNRCIGLPGGNNVQPGTSFYSTIAVATSNDDGHSWPAYRYALDPDGMPLYPLPSQNPSAGPRAAFGALGDSVCIGNDCNALPWPPDASYGRYAVLGPPVTIGDAMNNPATDGGLTGHVGDSAPAAFVDDVRGGPAPYLYEIHNYDPGPSALGNPSLPNGQNSDLMVSRAQLNGGTAPLAFSKWYQGSFSQPGLGGVESPVFPPGTFRSCEAPGQLKTMGAISFVEPTQQYLLTFVCMSPLGDPATGSGGSGAAWFFSTNDDLSHQDHWSTPQEIVGSWSAYDPNSPNCDVYSGWYPSLMSLNARQGRLSTRGYVFYMKGCTGGETPGGRQYSTRVFTITTARPGGDS